MTPRDDRLSTSIYYKDTDSHSYLNFGSSHPSKCKSSIPYSQFLRLRKIFSEDDVFQNEATTMETLFAARGNPHDLITRARLRAEEKQRADLLVTTPGSNCTTAERPPLVITYHPKNIAVCNIPLRNYTILRDDDRTKVTSDKPPLKAFRRAKNLKDLLFHSSLPQALQRQIGNFPCNRRDYRTCPFINPSDRITTTQGQIPQMPWCRLHRRDRPKTWRPFSGAPVGLYEEESGLASACLFCGSGPPAGGHASSRD